MWRSGPDHQWARLGVVPVPKHGKGQVIESALSLAAVSSLWVEEKIRTILPCDAGCVTLRKLRKFGNPPQAGRSGVHQRVPQVLQD